MLRLNFNFFFKMWSEKPEVSSKRVIATFMTLILSAVIFIWPDKQELIDSIMFFIGAMVAATVGNKHRAFQNQEKT